MIQRRTLLVQGALSFGMHRLHAARSQLKERQRSRRGVLSWPIRTTADQASAPVII